MLEGARGPHRRGRVTGSVWWCISALIGVMVLAGCSSPSGTSVGVVTGVEGTLSEVESFTILSEGEEITFAPIEGHSYEFPLDHLRDHLRSGEPVEVEWEVRDGVHQALAITDA